MPNYASATVVGHLGRDPEQKGDMVKASVAVTKKRKDKAPTTTWWNLTAFGKTGELMLRLHKGDAAGFVGEPELREYTDRDGVVKQSLDLTVRELIFLGGKGEQREQAPAQSWKDEAASGPPAGDDDIPF